MRKQGWIIYVIFLLSSGCATPQAVKSLSSEQLKVQKESRKACAEYFQIVEKTVENMVAVFKMEDDRILEESIAIYQKQYRNVSQKSGTDSVSLLQEMAEKIRKATEDTQQVKSIYDQRLASLQKKHRELLSTMDVMVDAQATLDAYIRLEKTDEDFASALFSTLGINRQILEKYEGELQQILPNALRSQKGKQP